MKKPNPARLLEELIENGVSESQIAAELAASDVRVSIPTLNKLRHGKHATTSFEIGYAILQLHARKVLHV